MCTVTYIPLGDKFVFTSNRDEAISRPLALAPALTEINGKKLLFPKDPLAGGTWFAVAAEGVVAVLLNGAFSSHIRKNDYRKSRGLVLVDIVAAENPLIELRRYDLERIEPFTIILYSKNSLMEFRWDGEAKHFAELNITMPYIYSSVTLYEPKIIKEREEWFAELLKIPGEKTPVSIREFHVSAGRGDMQNGLIMNRGGILRTQCITQAVVGRNEIEYYHHDLIAGTEDHKTLPVLLKV